VPNHMGIDSPWVIEHPDWFISRWESPFPAYSFNGPDLSVDSRVEIKIDDHYYDQSDAAVAFRMRYHGDGSTRYIYHGNDGTTFAWNDTAQLDYTKAHVREHVIQVILHVARLFPIIRFDAAMVLAKRHVQRLWFPLPGAGGSIPSRAENAMSQEDFDALMPHEFWREVVDRVAVEVPGTLLLAEAFWLLESYFVRTLGMHRVYNSAFMNMLRDEENAKYRSYLKKTIEFDPDILKRYVNFMSNPDERTAIDQFGSEDKYFGVCTLLATLPGLPMFGHGQIEGYTERYGMEFKQAKLDEWPNEHLVARHMREIAPLLKRRYIFAESWNFAMYDFWTGYGTVNENVFAYSNRLHGDRSIVLYNNAYVSTSGTIHISVASMDKGSGELRQRSLTDALDIPMDDELVVVYRDAARGLEFLKRAGDFHRNGLSMELRGYQYAVLLDWREFRHSAEWPWGELCDSLQGAGVPNADEALWKLRLKPVHVALRQAIEQGKVLLQAKSDAAEVVEFMNVCERFYVRAGEAVGVKHLGVAPMVADDIAAMQKNAAALAAKDKELTPVAAWIVLRALKVESFDQLLLRAGLAEIFAERGFPGEDAWRAAARVRLQLSFTDDPIRTRTFWNEPDARWLASVNEVGGKTYFNKEAFTELAGWMQLPALLGGELTTAKAAAELVALSLGAEEAGYDLGKFLKEEIAEEVAAETVEREAEVEAVEVAIDDAGEGEEEDATPVAPSAKP